MTVSIAPPSRPSQAETRRAIWNTIRGSSGNLVEWYDVYVYTVFARISRTNSLIGPIATRRSMSTRSSLLPS